MAPGSPSSASFSDSFQRLVDDGVQTVDALKSRVGDVSEHAYARLAAFITANPLKSVAIAFGIGYLAMRIKTSPLLKVALTGVFGYYATKLPAR